MSTSVVETGFLRATVERAAAHAGLFVICGAYLVLVIAYSALTPAWEANDEAEHVRYIERIIEHKRIPRISLANGAESHQPPAYYVLGAAWQTALRIPGFEPDPRPLPVLPLVVPRRATVELMRDHNYSPAEETNAKRVHALRGLSILLGLSTVLATYGIALLVLGRQDFALAASGFVAFLPKFDVIGATVTNDALVVAASSFALLTLLLYLRAASPRRTVWLAVVLGGLLGLAALAKFNSLPVAVACVGSLWLSSWPVSRRLLHTGLAVGTFALVAGWWFVRNASYYGDPFGREAANAYLRIAWPGLIDPVPWFDTERFFNFLPESLVQTSWYTGGWNQLFAPLAVNLGLTLLAAVSIFGAGRALVAPRSVPLTVDRRTYVATGACAVAGLLAVVLIAKDTLQAEGRITYVGLSAFAVVAVSGLVAITGVVAEHRQRVVAFIWPALLLVFNLYVLLRYVIPLRHL